MTWPGMSQQQEENLALLAWRRTDVLGLCGRAGTQDCKSHGIWGEQGWAGLLCIPHLLSHCPWIQVQMQVQIQVQAANFGPLAVLSTFGRDFGVRILLDSQTVRVGRHPRGSMNPTPDPAPGIWELRCVAGQENLRSEGKGFS